ncbi:MAG TPA: hypothetical protein VK284_08385 [Streptosporangiaceae bacterium]|nr:hypothetical protein [Streptosporangiaceae bacterium]
MLLQIAVKDIRQLTDIELHVQKHVQNRCRWAELIIRSDSLLAVAPVSQPWKPNAGRDLEQSVLTGNPLYHPVNAGARRHDLGHAR